MTEALTEQKRPREYRWPGDHTRQRRLRERDFNPIGGETVEGHGTPG